MVCRRTLTPWRDERALRWAYHERGLSQREIGELFGCTRGTIYHWMKKLGVEADPDRFPEASDISWNRTRERVLDEYDIDIF